MYHWINGDAFSAGHCLNKGVSFQNELIIQIMTESHEIDSLKRKMEDAKMKLITEIKVQDFPTMQFLLKSHMSSMFRHAELRPCCYIHVLFRKTNYVHFIIYFNEHDL